MGRVSLEFRDRLLGVRIREVILVLEDIFGEGCRG